MGVRQSSAAKRVDDSRNGGSAIASSGVGILRTPDELRGALSKTSQFDEPTSRTLRTRSEPLQSLEAGFTSNSAFPPSRVGAVKSSDPDGCEPTVNRGATLTDAREADKDTDENHVHLNIEIYADISCPFAHVSLRTVTRFRDQISPQVPILVRAWPLELVNGVPLDSAATAAHVAELRRDVAPGLFAGFQPGAMPGSTLKGLALVEAANDVDPWLGERISLDLRNVLFEEGRRIDDAMLAQLALENGLDASVLEDIGRVEARLAEGLRRGVRGSPHFFVGHNQFFCPLLDIKKDEFGGLHVQQRLDRLQSLLIQGLGSAVGGSGTAQSRARGEA